jgi:hypothetical protein
VLLLRRPSRIEAIKMGPALGDRGDSGGPNDPLISALIQKLPKAGAWPVDERVTWLRMLAMAFQVTYGQEPEIEIKKGP